MFLQVFEQEFLVNFFDPLGGSIVEIRKRIDIVFLISPAVFAPEGLVLSDFFEEGPFFWLVIVGEMAVLLVLNNDYRVDLDTLTIGGVDLVCLFLDIEIDYILNSVEYELLVGVMTVLLAEEHLAHDEVHGGIGLARLVIIHF